MQRVKWWFVSTVGVALAAGLNLLLSSLVRMRRIDVHHDENAIKHGKSVIYAFWHGRFWLLPRHLGHPGITVMISRSKDGEIIARVLSLMGYHATRGSSSRGGSEALGGLEQVLAQRRPVAITPDGPRGPRHHAQMGAVALAARTGAPIVPLGVSARPAWTLKSWDRFQIPMPLSRGVLVFGEPQFVGPEDDKEDARLALEQALIAAERRADHEVGR